MMVSYHIIITYQYYDTLSMHWCDYMLVIRSNKELARVTSVVSKECDTKGTSPHTHYTTASLHRNSTLHIKVSMYEHSCDVYASVLAN
jgi:hypothetical protein